MPSTLSAMIREAIQNARPPRDGPAPRAADAWQDRDQTGGCG